VLPFVELVLAGDESLSFLNSTVTVGRRAQILNGDILDVDLDFVACLCEEGVDPLVLALLLMGAFASG
jgi:hypothetical protein